MHHLLKGMRFSPSSFSVVLLCLLGLFFAVPMAYAEDPPKPEATKSGPASIVTRMSEMEKSIKEMAEAQQLILKNQDEIKQMVKQLKIWVRRS